jgi:hypothetical protein
LNLREGGLLERWINIRRVDVLSYINAFLHGLGLDEANSVFSVHLQKKTKKKKKINTIPSSVKLCKHSTTYGQMPLIGAMGLSNVNSNEVRFLGVLRVQGIKLG